MGSLVFKWAVRKTCCRNSKGENNTNMNDWDLIALLVTILLWIFHKNQRSVGSSLQCERIYGNFYTSLLIYICEYWIILIFSELWVKSQTLYLIQMQKEMKEWEKHIWNNLISLQTLISCLANFLLLKWSFLVINTSYMPSIYFKKCSTNNI